MLLAPQAASAADRDVALRVVTYNIHSCKGPDGKVRPDRIAEVLRTYQPDVVALQEVRVGRVNPKTVDRPKAEGPGRIAPPVGESPLPPPTVLAPRKAGETADPGVPFTDQPRAIAEALGMGYIFYPLIRSGQEDYGIALLSRHPMKLVRAANLPVKSTRWFSEQRGAIWAEITVDGREIQIIGTHLGLNRLERGDQVATLLGEDWLGSEKFSGDFVLCGDLNSTPVQGPYRRLAAFAVDAADAATGNDAQSTWPSRMPMARIDHVFMPRSAKAVAAQVPKGPEARAGSDHLPLVVDLLFPAPGQAVGTGDGIKRR